MQIYNRHKLLYEFGDRKMSPQMTIRIDPEIKKRSSKLVRAEGKTPGQALRELIENYIKQRDTRNYIDDLWTRIGGKLRSKDLKQRGINRVIKEARKASR
jgi:predicted DNA-binding protein